MNAPYAGNETLLAGANAPLNVVAGVMLPKPTVEPFNEG